LTNDSTTHSISDLVLLVACSELGHQILTSWGGAIGTAYGACVRAFLQD